MFCPKCGNSLSDGSAFCGKCGAQLGAIPKSPASSSADTSTAKTSTKTATSPQNAVLSGLSRIQIGTVVLVIAACVFALMPWFVTSESLRFVGETASAVSSFLTMGTYSTAHFEDSYTMFSLMDFVDDFGSYLGSSSSNGGKAGILVPLWAVGLAATAVGAILVALRKSRVLLVVGALVLGLVAAYYSLLFYPQFVQGDFAVSCINPIVCALCCLAALVLSVVGGSKTKKKQ